MIITSRTSSIIIIVNEILSGRTQELNSRFLAQRLLSIGITVNEVRIIPDNKNCIINCINNQPIIEREGKGDTRLFL